MDGRKGLLSIFAAFAAPVLIAAIVYKLGWFNAGVTNKGEFMEKEITLDWILPDKAEDTEWVIFYHIPQQCDSKCENVLYSLNQGFQALGKLQGKAHPVSVRSNESSMTSERLKSEFGYIQSREQIAAHNATLSELSSEFIYLVDPFGRVVLKYPAKADRQEAIMTTKDWMADLKRLLKYSRTS